MEAFRQITLDLEENLSKTEEISDNVLDRAEYAIGHCNVALRSMRQLVLDQGFPKIEDEIHFFKHIKPNVCSKLLYYQAVFEIESNRMKSNTPWLKKYLTKRLNEALNYLDKNRIKVQYRRCGFKHWDEKYFTRKQNGVPVQVKNFHSLIDEDFYSWQDHTFSMIMANEMLINYLQKEIEKMDNHRIVSMENSKSTLKWTGSKVALVELIYALHSSGTINSGNLGIKEVAMQFEETFNIDLKDYYRVFSEIKQRKVERTKFLDLLKSNLMRKMDESNI